MARVSKMSLLSMKSWVFVDGNAKLPLSSMKRAVFMDEGSGYLLYLNDLGAILNMALSS